MLTLVTLLAKQVVDIDVMSIAKCLGSVTKCWLDAVYQKVCRIFKTGVFIKIDAGWMPCMPTLK